METDIRDNAAKEYDLSTQYQWFCRLAQPAVDGRLKFDPEFAEHDWVIQCYNSIQEFERLFPDREACQEMLQKLEKDLRRIGKPIHPVEILRIWPKFLQEMEEEKND